MHEYATASSLSKTPNSCPPEEAVHSLTDEIAYAITDLEEVVSILSSRLDPVLAPEYDYETKSCSEPAPEVSALRVQLYRTHSVTASLRGILFRLEA